MHTGFLSLLHAMRPAWAVRGGPATPTTPATPSQWPARCGSLLTLRPSQPEDAALLDGLLNGGLLDGGLAAGSLSPAARRNRFHGSVGRLSPQRLAWLAGADQRSHAAFLVTQGAAGSEQAVAEGRWICSDGQPQAEFALCVADAWQGCGVGRRLLAMLVHTARQRGLHSLVGDVLQANLAMQALAASLQFNCDHHPDGQGLLRATLVLRQPQRRLLPATTWLH